LKQAGRFGRQRGWEDPCARTGHPSHEDSSPARASLKSSGKLLLCDPHVPDRGLWHHTNPFALRQGATTVALLWLEPVLAVRDRDTRIRIVLQGPQAVRGRLHSARQLTKSVAAIESAPAAQMRNTGFLGGLHIDPRDPAGTVGADAVRAL
jgi:hypothetical protein